MNALFFSPFFVPLPCRHCLCFCSLVVVRVLFSLSLYSSFLLYCSCFRYSIFICGFLFLIYNTRNVYSLFILLLLLLLLDKIYSILLMVFVVLASIPIVSTVMPLVNLVELFLLLSCTPSRNYCFVLSLLPSPSPCLSFIVAFCCRQSNDHG